MNSNFQLLYNVPKNPSQTASEPNAINIPVTQDYTLNYFINDVNNFVNSSNIVNGYINLIKLETGIMLNPVKGQLDNHTKIKNQNSIEAIYNYKLNKQNEIKNMSKTHKNSVNSINK